MPPESFIFINNTNQHVDYILLHHDLNIKTTGGVGPNDKKAHGNLQGFGKRAIVVWSKKGDLLYAGSGAEFQRGYNLFLTFQPRDPNQTGDFDYIVVPALGN